MSTEQPTRNRIARSVWNARGLPAGAKSVRVTSSIFLSASVASRNRIHWSADHDALHWKAAEKESLPSTPMRFVEGSRARPKVKAGWHFRNGKAPNRPIGILTLLACLSHGNLDAATQSAVSIEGKSRLEKQVTHHRVGHILTNVGAWSPNGEWLVYDTRSDVAGERFDGDSIEMVNVKTGEIKQLYQAQHGAYCGVATINPRADEVAFILGPEFPSPEWQYCAWHRQGVIVKLVEPRRAIKLDARDLIPPFTPGALRGGSHVHVWDGAGQWVSFTYEDHTLSQFTTETPGHEINLRNVGVSVPGHPVQVSNGHPRNHDGEYFSVLVTRTAADPRPGSDEIKKACEEGWVGTNGYQRVDGSRQIHALAFQGQVLSQRGETVSEVFIVDLPEDLSVAGDGPLAGTETSRPRPPRGVTQRRLTFSTERKFPGLQGPRHWLRSSPDGTKIAFLMKDDAGLAQLWTVSPNSGAPAQITHNQWPIASGFTWSPDGAYLAHTMDRSVCVTEVATGSTRRLTAPRSEEMAPRPEACVFSPDGKQIAFVRTVPTEGARFNQVFVVSFEPTRR